jgi:hypothetical protein
VGAADFALHRLYPNLREVGYIGHTASFSHVLRWYPRLHRPMRQRPRHVSLANTAPRGFTICKVDHTYVSESDQRGGM